MSNNRQPEAQPSPTERLNQSTTTTSLNTLREQIRAQNFNEAANALVPLLLNGGVSQQAMSQFMESLNENERSALLRFLSGSPDSQRRALHDQLQNLRREVGGNQPPTGAQTNANNPARKIDELINGFVTRNSMEALTNMLPANMRSLASNISPEMIAGFIKTAAAGMVDRVSTSLRPLIGNQGIVPVSRTAMELRLLQMPTNQQAQYRQRFEAWAANPVGDPPGPNAPAAATTQTTATTPSTTPGATPAVAPNAATNQPTPTAAEALAVGGPITIQIPGGADGTLTRKANGDVDVTIGTVSRTIRLPNNADGTPARIESVEVRRPAGQYAGVVAFRVAGRTETIQFTPVELRNSLNANGTTVATNLNPNLNGPITLAPVTA